MAAPAGPPPGAPLRNAPLPYSTVKGHRSSSLQVFCSLKARSVPVRVSAPFFHVCVPATCCSALRSLDFSLPLGSLGSQVASCRPSFVFQALFSLFLEETVGPRDSGNFPVPWQLDREGYLAERTSRTLSVDGLQRLVSRGTQLAGFLPFFGEDRGCRTGASGPAPVVASLSH